ncbi:PREDICTED: uncharacterized protein LOC105565842 [Vollenhovia emeryi]|uniref:uncharacterized protein LOC105565842 n=1 Tax=Vollenhovia emeryi TaxID=411798 RepID=UPI0005F51AEF|nr:PREDICTED: uncharacterized protein LOC105565842 [Vollenhovia emeryi]
MNVILIPFFLAADIAVTNLSHWEYGAEYFYNLNISYIANLDHEERKQSYQLLTTLSCRPKRPDHLFCQFQNVTQLSRNFAKNGVSTLGGRAKHMFEIKFNERGVESLIVDQTITRIVMDVVRKIANQFIMLVYPSNIGKWEFTVSENTTMGDCTTKYNITREKPETDKLERGNTKFQLVNLLMADIEPGTALFIDKSRKNCTKSPRDPTDNDIILETEKFASRYKIYPNKFRSFTRFKGTVRDNEKGAHVDVNDPSDWPFGPEYLYDLNITYIVNKERFEHKRNFELINTLSCRPKMENSLVCQLKNRTQIDFKFLETIGGQAEDVFEIKFTDHGVAGLNIDQNITETMMNIMQKIANQFNVYIDQSNSHAWVFPDSEHSSIGNCTTIYTLSIEKPKTDSPKVGHKNFRLVILLPVDSVDTEGGNPFVIEKSRMVCSDAAKDITYQASELEMERFISRYKICPNKFRSFTRFKGREEKPRIKNTDLSVKELIHINLKSIKPAQDKLPTISNGRPVQLDEYMYE